MQNQDELIQEFKKDILDASKHLEWSFHRAQKISTNLNLAEISPEDLEVWEGLVARFGRVSDIFLSKYLRLIVLRNDPGFKGEMIDYINKAEKLGLIESSQSWIEIREIRNTSVHEYAEEKLERLFERVLALTPLVLSIRTKI